MKQLFLVIFLSFFSLGALISCTAEDDNDESSTLTTANYAYITVNSSSQAKIVVTSIGSDGALTEVEQQNALTNPQDVVATPNGSFLYVSNWSGGIQAFSITPSTGALTAIETETLGDNIYAGQMKVSGDGAYLFVETRNTSSSADSSIQSFAIGADGALTATGSTIAIGYTLHSLLLDSNNANLYLTGSDADQSNASTIYHATVSSGNMTLSTLSLQPNNTTYGTIATLSRDGSDIYMANSNASNFVSIARIGISSTGALDTSDTSNNVFVYGTDFVVHPSLNVMYSTYGNSSTPTSGGVYVYALADTGEISSAAITTDETTSAYDLDILADGSVLLNARDQEVASYTLDSAGALTKIGELDLSAIDSIINVTAVRALTVTY